MRYKFSRNVMNIRYNNYVQPCIHCVDKSWSLPFDTWHVWSAVLDKLKSYISNGIFFEKWVTKRDSH